MSISGSDALLYNVVRLDDFSQVNKGPLISANDVTGEVVYQDTPESQKTLTLGPHAIRIVKAGR